MTRIFVSLAFLLCTVTTFEPKFFTEQTLSLWFSIFAAFSSFSSFSRVKPASFVPPLLLIIIIGFFRGLFNADYDLSHTFALQSASQFFETKSIKGALYVFIIFFFSTYLGFFSGESESRLRLHWDHLRISLIACELFGALQFLLYIALRIDIKQIFLYGDFFKSLNPIGVPLIVLQDSLLGFRLTSWCHEPKGFAGFLSLLIFLKLFSVFVEYTPRPLFIDSYFKKTIPLSILLLAFTQSINMILIPLSLLSSFIVLDFMISRSRIRLSLLRKRHNRGLILRVIFLITLLLCLLFAIQVLFSLDFSSIILRRFGDNQLGLSTFDYFLNSIDPEDAATVLLLLSTNFFDFLFGLGFGGFAIMVSISDSINQLISYDFTSPFVRNILLEVFFIAGIVGVALVFRLYYRLVRVFVEFSSLIFDGHTGYGSLSAFPLSICLIGFCSIASIPLMVVGRGHEFTFCLLLGASGGASSLLYSYSKRFHSHRKLLPAR